VCPLEETRNSRGKVTLFSELKVCDSCVSVIKQFKASFPNIKIIIKTGPKESKVDLKK